MHDKYHHYIFRHWGAIFRKSTDTGYHKSNITLQILIHRLPEDGTSVPKHV